MTASPPTYASFWKRLNAYGYDVLIVQLMALVAVVSAYPFPTLADALSLSDPLKEWLAALTNSTLFISALYNILFVVGPWQATPGKRFCGIYIANADGSRLTLLQATLRHALSGISMLFMGLPTLTICYSREKLAPHDMLCHTRVIRGKTNP